MEQKTVSTAYVNARPLENFTHRGKGRWFRGLPPLDADVRTGVRGPGGAQWRIHNAAYHANSAAPPSPAATSIPARAPQYLAVEEEDVDCSASVSMMDDSTQSSSLSPLAASPPAPRPAVPPIRAAATAARAAIQANSAAARSSGTGHSTASPRPVVSRAPRLHSDPHVPGTTFRKDRSRFSLAEFQHKTRPEGVDMTGQGLVTAAGGYAVSFRNVPPNDPQVSNGSNGVLWAPVAGGQQDGRKPGVARGDEREAQRRMAAALAAYQQRMEEEGDADDEDEGMKDDGTWQRDDEDDDDKIT